MNKNSDEFKHFLGEKLSRPSFLEKSRKKVSNALISDAELEGMRSTIISEMKGPFSEYIENKGSDQLYNKFTIDNFENRIRTLPKDNIIDIFSDIECIKEMESIESKKNGMDYVCNRISLSYSLNRWYRNILLNQ